MQRGSWFCQGARKDLTLGHVYMMDTNNGVVSMNVKLSSLKSPQWTARQGLATALRLGLLLVGATLSMRVLAGDILVPAGAVWKYLDNGSNQGSAWRAPNFDD